MASALEVELDYHPRSYQLNAIKALNNGIKKIVLPWHRRSGKDITIFNWCIYKLLQEVCTCYYIMPTYSQAKKVIWDAITIDGRRIIDYIPSELIAQKNSQEMKIRLVNGSMMQLIGSDNIDCFDEETEILTERGWVYFRNLVNTDKVASLENECLKFITPQQIVKYFHSGDMYRISSNSIDALITPNHRFYVKSSKGFAKFKYISDETIRHDKIPASSNWEGDDESYFEFPKIVSEWQCGKGRLVRKEYSRTVKMRPFVKLLGIFLAEGSTFSNHKCYRVRISQIKPHTRDEIRDLLKELEIKFVEHKNGFSFEDKQLYFYFNQFGKQKERFIPFEVKRLSKDYLQELINWMMKGDGHGTHYYTTSKKLADDVQEVAIKLGKSAVIREKRQNHSEIKGRKILSKDIIYDVSIKTSEYHYLSGNGKSYVSKTKYTGMVYCVSVPSGIIKVRRNGYEYFSGNSLMGTNPKIVVFSEYALQDPAAWDFIRPILAVNGGYAIFISTPRGKNHFWELYRSAQANKEWFCEKLTIEDTKVLTREQYEKEIKEGMSEELALQEYYCSFDRGIDGSVYSKLIYKMRGEDRICALPHDPYKETFTSWDIGWNDPSAVLFFQLNGNYIDIIDAESYNASTLAEWAKILKNKPYHYGMHLFPHDVDNIDGLGSGCTRKEILGELGITATTVPKHSISDAIEATKKILASRIRISNKCNDLLKSLEFYHYEWDDKHKVYGRQPRHDWSSHFCDSLKYLATGLHLIGDKNSSLDGEYKALRNYWGG